ncbi:efflux RND transporter periplasmic adaptor subunit [Pseudooceanicola onchidii]|uniref:efflux RND transporter periplasmic adaptor subunit n=1 Tax=Pseudooceanicola onchidii TaxID=2562279 RepID=UPI0010AA8AE2|nr:efflux RND transporter periplasmic adaptor subunit [Pseudooceanicola onchidii]
MADKPQDPPKPDWALTGRERKVKAAQADGRRGPRRRWPWIVVALAAVGAGAWVAQDRGLLGTPPAEETADAPAPETPAETQAPAREVVMQLLPGELTRIEPTTLRDTVRLTGSLAPVRQLGIPAEVSGRVQRVAKKAGQTAVEGETLIQIDLETLRNQLEQSRATADATRAQLDYAQEQFTRTQSLVDRGVSASSTLDSNEANVRQLRANLAALEKQVSNAERAMEKATITAPFPGVVSERLVDPGAYVSPGTALMTLVDVSSLELEGAVPVNYGPRIQTGQTVELTVDGFGDQSFSGKIERVAPVAVSGTRMLPIYATIDNPDEVLRGGMFASGLLVLDQVTDAFGVPVDAIREDGDGSFVLKRDGGRVVRQPVTLGQSWDRGRVVQVTEGLTDGDVIVTAAMPRLQPGMQITVVGE